MLEDQNKHYFVQINKTRHETCALQGYYAASNGNPLRTFRDNVSVPSVNDYNSTLRSTPEKGIYHQHRGGSLKSRKPDTFRT
jgi:hypothetical protein